MIGEYEIEIEVSRVVPTGEVWNVFHAGELLMESKDPIHDAARELWNAGAGIDDTLFMYPKGSRNLSLSGRIGYLAARRTSETHASGPRTVLWTWSPSPFGNDENEIDPDGAL